MSVLPGSWGSQAGTQWGLPSQQSPYEFYNVDVIYDFLMSIGVKPGQYLVYPGNLPFFDL